MGTLGGGSRIPKGGQVSGTGASVLQGDWRGAIREEGGWEKCVGEGNESRANGGRGFSGLSGAEERVREPNTAFSPQGWG